MKNDNLFEAGIWGMICTTTFNGMFASLGMLELTPEGQLTQSCIYLVFYIMFKATSRRNDVTRVV